MCSRCRCHRPSQSLTSHPAKPAPPSLRRRSVQPARGGHCQHHSRKSLMRAGHVQIEVKHTMWIGEPDLVQSLIKCGQLPRSADGVAGRAFQRAPQHGSWVLVICLQKMASVSVRKPLPKRTRGSHDARHPWEGGSGPQDPDLFSTSGDLTALNNAATKARAVGLRGEMLDSWEQRGLIPLAAGGLA